MQALGTKLLVDGFNIFTRRRFSASELGIPGPKACSTDPLEGVDVLVLFLPSSNQPSRPVPRSFRDHVLVLSDFRLLAKVRRTLANICELGLLLHPTGMRYCYAAQRRRLSRLRLPRN